MSKDIKKLKATKACQKPKKPKPLIKGKGMSFAECMDRAFIEEYERNN